MAIQKIPLPGNERQGMTGTGSPDLDLSSGALETDCTCLGCRLAGVHKELVGIVCDAVAVDKSFADEIGAVAIIVSGFVLRAPRRGVLPAYDSSAEYRARLRAAGGQHEGA